MNQRVEIVESFFIVLSSDESSSPCTILYYQNSEVLQILDFMPAAVQNHLSQVSLDICPRLSHFVLLYLTEFIAKNMSLSALIPF